MSDRRWQVEQHQDGSFTIRDPDGEIVTRARNVEMLLTYYAMALDHGEELRAEVDRLRCHRESRFEALARKVRNIRKEAKQYKAMVDYRIVRDANLRIAQMEAKLAAVRAAVAMGVAFGTIPESVLKEFN